MKRSQLKPLIFSVCTAGCSALMFPLTTSCDTPQTIAWSYYECARDTLESGDPHAALRFLKACNKSADKTLTHKADSLMKVIEEELAKQKAL